MGSVTGYVRLMRPLNAFIGTLGILLGAHLTGNLSLNLSLGLAILTAIAMTGGANAINDFYDYEIDKINKPHRPLPSGLISREHSRYFAYVLFGIGCVASALIGPWPLVIAGISIFLLEGYSRWWKGTPVIGNVVVSLMIAVAFFYGSVVFGNGWAALPPACMGFLYTWGREIIKDLEDAEGDAAQAARTFPLLFGDVNAKILTTGLFLLLLFGVLLPYVLDVYNVVYFVMVLVGVDLPIVYVLVRLWKWNTPENYRHLSHVLKADMFIGLIAVFIGSF